LKALVQAYKKLHSRQPKHTYPKIVLLEYGIDHPGEMAFLLTIAKPDYTIHTQIDSVHSLQFGNPDNIAKEEFLLEQNTRHTVFLNTDDPYLHHVNGTIPCDVISYSASKKNTTTTISIAKDSTDIYKTGELQKYKEGSFNPAIVQQETITFNDKKTITLGINLL
jgi:UDP-N-acetylmuramyl pentapeptide synthase